MESQERYNYFYRTIPSDNFQVHAMVEMIIYFNWTYISVVYEESSYGKVVRKMFFFLIKIFRRIKLRKSDKKNLKKNFFSGFATTWRIGKTSQHLYCGERKIAKRFGGRKYRRIQKNRPKFAQQIKSKRGRRLWIRSGSQGFDASSSIGKSDAQIHLDRKRRVVRQGIGLRGRIG